MSRGAVEREDTEEIGPNQLWPAQLNSDEFYSPTGHPAIPTDTGAALSSMSIVLMSLQGE